jgi:hypothetical protein
VGEGRDLGRIGLVGAKLDLGGDGIPSGGDAFG